MKEEIKYLVLNEFMPNDELRSYCEMSFADMKHGVDEFFKVGKHQLWFTDKKENAAAIVDFCLENGDIVKDQYLTMGGLNRCISFYNWPFHFFNENNS